MLMPWNIIVWAGIKVTLSQSVGTPVLYVLAVVVEAATQLLDKLKAALRSKVLKITSTNTAVKVTQPLAGSIIVYSLM